MATAVPFSLLVITPEGQYPQEIRWVSRLFEKGLDTLHLRKPDWKADQVLNYVEQLDACWHPRVMVHHHTSLLEHVKLKGVHLRAEALPQLKTGCAVSCPVHSWEEFTVIEERVDYALISPFFNSISKQAYAANARLHELPRQAQLAKAIALGGVAGTTVEKVRQLGLGGAALLGAVWQTAHPLAAFLSIQKKVHDA